MLLIATCCTSARVAHRHVLHIGTCCSSPRVAHRHVLHIGTCCTSARVAHRHVLHIATCCTSACVAHRHVLHIGTSGLCEGHSHCSIFILQSSNYAILVMAIWWYVIVPELQRATTSTLVSITSNLYQKYKRGLCLSLWWSWIKDWNLSCAEDLNYDLSGVEGCVIEAQEGFFIVWSRDYCDLRSGRLDSP